MATADAANALAPPLPGAITPAREKPSTSWWQDTWRRFSRQRQTNRFQKHKREHDASAVLVDQFLHD